MTIETANRLYELRKKQGLSQEELAEKLGVSRQAVSKWERSEASPDTDNLIALAKLYNLSLDELIYGEKEHKEEAKSDPKEESQGKVNKVDIGPAGIFVESDDGDKVQISLKGIKITEGKHIEFEGDDVDVDDDDDDDGNDDVTIIGADGRVKINVNKRIKGSFWRHLPYPTLCVVAYLLFGCLDILGGWALSWIVFVSIPVYYSLVDAICKRKFSEFAYPVFSALAFLYLGLYHGWWHPSWIIFVTIPLYYSIANALDKKTRAKKQSKE